MGSIATTKGMIRVRDCPEGRSVLKALGELAEGMDERRIDVRKADEAGCGPGVLEVEISVSGWCSATHAVEIDEKIRELGPYAVETARFFTERECERTYFFVGGDTAAAESADALVQIQVLAPRLRGDDITAALNVLVCDTQMPAYKRRYLEKSGGRCPFCESRNISSGQLEADGPVAWAGVECEDCGASWQDMWSLTDIDHVRNKDGEEIGG